MRLYLHRLAEIRQLAPDFSSPQISELLGIPVKAIRGLCRHAGIKMRRGPRGPHPEPRVKDNESGFHSRQFVVAGSSPCFTPGGIRRVGDKVETHGPVRILMQNGKRT